MKHLALTLAVVLAPGAASAQSATDLLAGTKWGWLGFEHDASKIPESEKAAARIQACAKPNIAFRSANGDLVELDFVVSPPSPTVFDNSRIVKKNKGELLIEAFYGPVKDKADQTFVLTDGGGALAIDGGMFGVWHYVRCAQLGETTYQSFRPSPGSNSR